MHRSASLLLKQYDRFAEEYMNDQNKFYSRRPDDSREILHGTLNFPLHGKKLLDGGCGFGKDLEHYRKSGADAFGLDASKKMIKLAKKNYPGLKKLLIAQFERTPFRKNFFDVIISRFAMQDSADLEKVFMEFHRILKQGGFLIFLAAHPLRQFLLRKKKAYDRQEMVRVPVFGSNFGIMEPTHTFSDYLSGFIFENFEVLSFKESRASGDRNREVNIPEIVPDFFVLKLRKKRSL